MNTWWLALISLSKRDSATLRCSAEWPGRCVDRSGSPARPARPAGTRSTWSPTLIRSIAATHDAQVCRVQSAGPTTSRSV